LEETPAGSGAAGTDVRHTLAPGSAYAKRRNWFAAPS
jgi:hypothetical protein